MVGLIGSLRGSSYKIPNSLRFRANASAYLNRTPTVVGNRKTWTWSGWVKIGNISSVGTLFGNVANQYEQHYFGFNNEALGAYFETSNGTTKTLWTTTSVFRDPSAWYHIVVVFDTTQPTVANMCKFYVNGLLQTITIDNVSQAYITQNANGYINSSDLHTIGSGLPYYSGRYFDGYLAEVNFIDGQALAPSSFGRISGSTGVWSPKKYTGTYGTNGFYLNFKDNSAATSAAIGKDYSGNYNNWTPNNISLIAGTSYDSMVDSPTPYGDSLQYFTGTRYPYNALNFRSSASTYFSRTPSVAGNRTTWTWSGWVTRRSLGTSQVLFTTSTIQDNDARFFFDNSNNLRIIYDRSGSLDTGSRFLSQIFNDESIWYHIVVATDTTQSIAIDRCKVYVNGVRVTSFLSTSDPAQNTATPYNSVGNTHLIGGSVVRMLPYDGYMADINLIDGQALTPSSFGETVNGVWKPKTYSGTYGTNGFYLKFNDNSAATATALGKDSAGSNNWTPTNLAVTDVTSTDITSVKLVNPNYGLQFRSSASTYLSRIPAVGGNQKTWTWSGWVKRGSVGSFQSLFEAGTVKDQTNTELAFDANNTITLQGWIQASAPFARTANVFSDNSAWYHIVAVFNSTNLTTEDRMILYVNGQRQTLQTYIPPSINLDWGVNNDWIHIIGKTSADSLYYFNGYLADINFIDGQALTPSSFGETIDGAWVPKSYTGTYGTNGFYLNFADRSAMTAAAIGNDASSNSNNWTPNGFIISDAIDYTAKTARGNYPTLNPLSIVGGSVSLAAGNTLVTVPNSSNQGAMATMVCNGKNYFETQGNAFGSNVIAICCTTINVFAVNIVEGITYNSDGRLYINGVQTTVPTYTSADVIGVTVDTSTREIKVYKNNVQIGTTAIATGTGDLIFGVVGSYLGTGSGSTYVNFGQRPFVYTPPAGFKALNTYNLPAPAISNAASYMAATTYTGTGAALSVNNITNNKTFKPDLVWIKSRSAATNHALYDSVRGVQKDLVSNSTAAETTQTAGLLAFNDNGFNIGTLPKLNTNATYVAWQWKANGSTVANTAGTITSQVNAGVNQGFSVVSYTGTGANATVGHGLGVAPKMIIVKNRSTINNWEVYHDNLPSAATTIQLSNTDSYNTVPAAFNSTDPTTSVFSVGTSITTNGATNSLVAYCFSEVAGYSKFGSYIGNGSNDGPFVYCGFRPRWIMLKNTVEALGNWMIYDTSRDTHNLSKYKVGANTNLNENESMVILGDSTWGIDILSNGFKIRIYSGPNHNTASVAYIFAAFAETPFKYSLAR